MAKERPLSLPSLVGSLGEYVGSHICAQVSWQVSQSIPKEFVEKALTLSSSSQPSACWGGMSVLPPEALIESYVTVYDSISSPVELWRERGWGLRNLQHLDETPRRATAWRAASPPASFTHYPQVCFLGNACILLGQLDSFFTQIYGVPSWRHWPLPALQKVPQVLHCPFKVTSFLTFIPEGEFCNFSAFLVEPSCILCFSLADLHSSHRAPWG